MIDLYEYKGRTPSGDCETIFWCFIIIGNICRRMHTVFLSGGFLKKDEFKSYTGATIDFDVEGQLMA